MEKSFLSIHLLDIPQSNRLLLEAIDDLDNPPDYCPNTIASAPPLSRDDLESRIIQLWKTIWLGLYKVKDTEGPSHYDWLQALSRGAGFGNSYGVLGSLNRHFLQYSTINGMASLKLFDNTSMSTLRCVVDILEAYESEIPNLEQLYSILRRAQIGLHQKLDDNGRDDSQKAIFKKRYLALAEPMGRRLTHYDNRMDVLTIDMYEEAATLRGDGLRDTGQHVYYRAFRAVGESDLS
ncbi:hypothetical protein N7474_002842 [Penicillium riverlandense]|uniref:uncharacterized protein n=1 Tax=Penicillium riverlandense TaxID=1903569 RepID=UPI002549029C|nr:uncharacterized protein N7474_002842 [Penicillium riverlandense]KAJ5825704.1 hypothetical protein N7474_002842 [Penicillium riverlandense]